MVNFGTDEDPNICRVIVHPNVNREGPPRYLVTHLEADQFSAQQASDAYRLRWQIELLFKELKSFNNLHAFDTANPFIVEGLIWASLCTATLSRYYAHVTEQCTAIMISTQRVAQCINNVLRDIFYDILHRPRRLKTSVTRAIQYLTNNATRAHPKRDAKTGRFKLEPSHIFVPG